MTNPRETRQVTGYVHVRMDADGVCTAVSSDDIDNGTDLDAGWESDQQYRDVVIAVTMTVPVGDDGAGVDAAVTVPDAVAPPPVVTAA